MASAILSLGFAVVSCSEKDTKDVATCSDGIKNQGEEDVDCGGPCPPCVYPTTMSATVSGFNWIGMNMSATLNGGLFTITADNGTTPLWQLIMVHNGPQAPGTYNLASSTKILNLNSKEFFIETGTITFTEFNTTQQRVSGTFTFVAKHPGETLLIEVKNGKFANLTY